MKRLLFAVFLALFLVTPAGAQGLDIYLPAISKGDDMAMAILEISDGTTTVSLLAGKQTGFHLEKWRPAIVQPKGGGVYQDSSIASGRELVFAVDGTANEVFNLKINDDDQDELIRQTQDLLRLLLKARNHGLASWQDEPVWIKARAACETNARYARVLNFTIEELDNPYVPPFFNAGQIVTMDGITLGLERGHWLGNPPGVGACTQVSAVQSWLYNNVWQSAAVDIQPAVLFQTNSGAILMAGLGGIYRSADDGVTWGAVSVLPAFAFVQTATGRIIGASYDAPNGAVVVSDDDGATWAQVLVGTSLVSDVLVTTSGKVIITDLGQLWFSTDDGNTWNNVALPSSTYSITCLLQLSSGRILAGGYFVMLYSDDDGVSWQVVSTSISIVDEGMIQTSTGKILAGSQISKVFASTDNGDTWFLATTIPANTPLSLVQLSSGEILMGETGNIWHSIDDGVSFQLETALPVSDVYTIIESSTGKILAGDMDSAIISKPQDVADMGRGATCTDTAFVANRQNVANLTHIFVDDGGVFGVNLFPMAVFPVSLLPAAAAVNDAVYFGIDTSITDTGPFGGLVFDLSAIVTYTTSYVITWEVWTGAAWVALTVQDGTNPGAGAFGNLGTYSVHWAQPSGWATTAVNGVTGYWVRARVSALVGTMTAPAQQNRNIYAPVLPYVEIAAAQVAGDIPAVAQIKAHNRSDKDGPGGSGPDLWANRLVVGLRSYDRGASFQAYLNISDEQNPAGATVTLGTNTTFGADATGPTGRAATYNPGGVEAMATRATITLGPTIARDFYGTFHAFLRGQRSAGASTDLTVRLQIATGSGGVTATTESRQFQTTTAFELIDFGMVTIPAAGSLKFSEMGDTTEIRVQASAASGVPNLVLYDLVLIPTDEYPIDAVDVANESDSEVGQSGGFAKLLDLDSVTNPKTPIRALVRRVGSELVTSIYNPVTPGEVILQANALQRLWSLAARTSATGASYYWLSPPEISHSIQVYANSRYLGMRGNR